MVNFQRICLIVPVVVLAACSVTAQPYSASLDNVQVLKNAAPVAARLGTFTNDKADGDHETIMLRTAPMHSPVGNSFAEYLSDAIRQEFLVAGALAPGASIELSGVLLTNNEDANIGTGRGTISARFIVKQGTDIRYDSVKSAANEWDSSFVAAVAIPRAVNAYPHLVKNLLAALYADPAFIKAIK